ncbi:hypothetical protein BD779DRAFT_1626698 [Infundibulicybe gibba]|nr:hypothetical protein BD779DRAFT_1626698 [Infundibulicybe gibba]
MIDDLEKRKTGLLELAGAHKVAISPLRTFPPELLAKIFMEFVLMERCRTPRRNYSPFMLTGICSRWRRIVLDTPRLWTRISGAVPMIYTWVVRSRELPLDLELDLDSPDAYTILQALIPHSHRWGHATFCLGPGSSSTLARVRTRLHSLKSLALSFEDTTGPWISAKWLHNSQKSVWH